MSDFGHCAGCGRVGLDRARELELFPGRRVRLCDGIKWVGREVRGAWYLIGKVSVSASCLRRAREKLALCPGCGTEGCQPGLICMDCASAIDRDRDARERGGAELRWRNLNLSSFAPYLGHAEDPERAVERFGRLLMRACAAGRCSDSCQSGAPWIPTHEGWVGCPSAEMTDAQAEALGEFLGMLDAVCRLYSSDGERDGRNLLLQLREGRLSLSELDERTERGIAERERALAELARAERRNAKGRSRR